MTLRSFTKHNGEELLVVCGYFNKAEIRQLKSEGYHQTWKEDNKTNKNGIRVK